MPSEEEGLRAMSGEPRRAVGEPEQDVDQRTQVTEGVVLPERVVSELVCCSVCCPPIAAADWTCMLLLTDQ